MATSEADTTREILAEANSVPLTDSADTARLRASGAWNRLNRALTRQLPADVKRGRRALDQLRRRR